MNHHLKQIVTALSFITLAIGLNSPLPSQAAESADQNQEQPIADAFPELISFYDLMQLNPAQRETYIADLSKLLAEISRQDRKSQLPFVADSAPNPLIPSASALQFKLNVLLFALLNTTRVANASDQQQSAGTPCGFTYSDPSSHKTVYSGTLDYCAVQSDGNKSQCLCVENAKAIENQYNGDKKHPLLTDEKDGCPYFAEDWPQDYIKVHLGGHCQIVDKDSYEGVKSVLPPVSQQGFQLLTRSNAASKRLKPGVMADIQRENQQVAKQGYAVDSFTGEKKSNVFVDGKLSDAIVHSIIADEAAAKALELGHIINSPDPTVRTNARTALDDQAAKAVDSSDKSRKDFDDAAKAEEAKLAELQAEKQTTPGPVLTQTQEAADTATRGAMIGSTLEDTKDKLVLTKDVVKAADPQDPLVPKLDGDQKAVGKDTLAVDDNAVDLVKKTQDLLSFLSAKGKDLGEGVKEQYDLLNKKLQDLKSAIPTHDPDKIAAQGSAVLDATHQACANLNIPTSECKLNRPEQGEITCKKTGEFQCLDKLNKKDKSIEEARSNYMKSRGGDKKCIFGGSASEFGEVEGRNGTVRVGCKAIKDFTFDGENGSVTLECPPAKNANKKPVICNPLLYGYEVDKSGKAWGRCVDWNAVVTADCQEAYWGKHAGQPGNKVVTGSEFLTNPKNRLEKQWTELAAAISNHCNSAMFRSLNCKECSTIAERLSSMKAKATNGTCRWSDSIDTIRATIKGGITK